MSEELLKMVRQAQQGDTQAFEKIIQIKQKEILYIASCYCKPEDVEDSAQEAMINMYRKLPELKNAESFLGWMYTIIKNTCSNYSRRYRAQKRSKGTLSLNAVVDKEENQAAGLRELRKEFLPADYVEQKEKRQVLMQAVEALQQDYRECLLLFYYEDLTYKEIAEVLGVSEKKVANNLVRGRTKLKKYLEKHTQGEIFFSALPAGALPVLTRFFSQAADERITDEMVAKATQGLHHFLQQSAVSGATAGAVAATASKEAVVGASLFSKVVAGVAVAGLVGGAAVGGYYLLAPQPDPAPIEVVAEAPTPEATTTLEATLTPTPEATAEATPTPTPAETVPVTETPIAVEIPEEVPVEEEPEPFIETLEDMIGVEPAAALAVYESTGVAPQEWEAFAWNSGLEIVREASETAASYAVYVREEQQWQLVVAVKQPVAGENWEVRYQFGEIKPLENMVIYILWF